MIPLRALIVVAGAVALLFTVASHARAETCIASQYGTGDGYGGKRTASGEVMRPSALTAAMRKPQPLGSRVTVTNLASGKSVVVKINDRGPFVRGRCIDLSRAAANAIGMGGLARVSVSARQCARRWWVDQDQPVFEPCQRKGRQ